MMGIKDRNGMHERGEEMEFDTDTPERAAGVERLIEAGIVTTDPRLVGVVPA